VQWRTVEGHDRPYEATNEIVTFILFIEHGFGVPSIFFRGLVFYWGIQAHHLTPNSTLHISIFVHLCEIFLGIKPHFNLFRHLFHLKPEPNAREIDEVGGVGLHLRQEMEKKYLCYSLYIKKYWTGRQVGFILETMPQH